jgi:hypothetical protein
MKKILYQLRCFYPLGKLALFVKVLGLKISVNPALKLVILEGRIFFESKPSAQIKKDSSGMSVG